MANDLMFRPAVELAAMVRGDEVSSRELVEAAFEAIDRRNGELNAFVTLCEERALAEADAIEPGDDRPFAGVPIAIKDLVAATAGLRTTMGMKAMGDWVPETDTALVRRIREAGAIIVGKTNTPELGILPVTEPERFGPARNPWDPSRTTGGSSGGSAAAVAAGMVPIAHANDGGGSIRIPASCCGLVGLKASRGRVSLAPLGEFVGGIATEGVVSRTVRDTAVALDVLAGYEPGDPYWVSDPSEPFAAAVDREPGTLRVAFSAAAPNGVPVDDDCVAATRETAELLESLGHTVFEAPALSDEGYIDSFIKIWVTGVAANVREAGAARGRPIDLSELEPLTAQMVEMAQSISGADYLQSLEYLRGMSRRIASLWSDLDVLLTPTLAKPAIEIGELNPKEGEPPIQMLNNAALWVPFTPVWNVTGQPAISIPIHQSETGLPVGVQLVGAAAAEDVLLSLSAQLEQARPWAQRRPELAAA
jgi:amidase